MIEVEVKLPICIYSETGNDGAGSEQTDCVMQQLRQIGFQKTSVIREQDAYFDNAAHYIRNSGQAFRIRIETDLATGNESALLTFKGQRMDRETVTRPEYETRVEDSAMALKILEGLGYMPVEPQVIKHRTMLELEQMTACIDKVEDLGDFLELEILVETKADKDAALEKIKDILGMLGYSLADCVQRSYLSMLQMNFEENI